MAYIRETKRAHAGDLGAARSVVFEGRWRDPNAVRGIEGFSHLWVLWASVDAAGEDAQARVELTCAALLGVRDVAGQGRVLDIEAPGLVSGAPVFDIKPYIPASDALDSAR